MFWELISLKLLWKADQPYLSFLFDFGQPFDWSWAHFLWALSSLGTTHKFVGRVGQSPPACLQIIEKIYFFVGRSANKPMKAWPIVLWAMPSAFMFGCPCLCTAQAAFDFVTCEQWMWGTINQHGFMRFLWHLMSSPDIFSCFRALVSRLSVCVLYNIWEVWFNKWYKQAYHAHRSGELSLYGKCFFLFSLSQIICCLIRLFPFFIFTKWFHTCYLYNSSALLEFFSLKFYCSRLVSEICPLPNDKIYCIFAPVAGCLMFIGHLVVTFVVKIVFKRGVSWECMCAYMSVF